MKLTIVGTGYVGLVTGACLANSGNQVTCLDVDQSKVDMIREGRSPIYEPGLEDLLRRNLAAGRLVATTDKAAAYRDAEVVFICVGTPPREDGSADLRYVLDVAADVAEQIEALGPEAPAKLVVVKSTVPVGTSHRVRDVIRERTDLPFHFANNPEFLKEGDALSDFMKPDRIVCGVESEEAEAALRELYAPFVRRATRCCSWTCCPRRWSSTPPTQCSRARSRFINEMAKLCETLRRRRQAAVREGMCADSPHRQPVPLPRPRLRRLVLPQGHAGRGGDGPPGGNEL